MRHKQNKVRLLSIAALLALSWPEASGAQELGSFEPLIGQWSCEGKFTHSGKTIQSDISFQRALEAHWIIVRHDDKPPFTYHAMYEWGWETDSKRYVSAVQDSTGHLRLFYSSGWNGNTLNWETEQDDKQRFSYERIAGDELRISFAIHRKDEWGLIDTIVCERKPDADREAVIAMENEWLSHISDGPTLERILADDFVHPVPGGTFVTKQQHIRWAVGHSHPATWGGKFERLDVRIYGTTAIANGIVAATEAPDAVARRTIFTDVFVFRDGHWRAVNAQENEIASGR